MPGPPAQVVDRGDPNRQMVALTFDAGSDVGFASQILDTLARERVAATFGITGKWAEENPDLVRRMAADGHQIVNHTYDHRSFTGFSTKTPTMAAEQRRSQIERTEEVIRELTGRTTRPWFRPPYGDYDDSVNTLLGETGYRYNAMWTVDSLGYTGLTADAVRLKCLGRASPGAIYLFHVGEQAKSDHDALPSIIQGLRQYGYAFGTLADVTGLQ